MSEQVSETDEEWANVQEEPLVPFVVSLVLGLGLAAVTVSAPAWMPPTADFLWGHWPWPVCLAAALLLGLIAIVFFDSGAPLGVLLVLAVPIALHLDGIWSALALAKRDLLFMPIWAWLLFLAVMGVATFILDSLTEEDLFLVWFGLPLAILAIVLIYLGWRATTDELTLQSVDRAAGWASSNWPPIAFALSALILARRWRRIFSGTYRFIGDDEDDYRFRYVRYENDASASEGGNSTRGRWLRRAVAVIQRSGLEFLDLALMLITLVLLGITLLYYIPDHIVSGANLTPAEAARGRADERRTVLAILAAVGAGITLVYTHLRHQLDRDASTSTRFRDGVAQLATETLSTRLGGLYSLGQVARESQRDADNVVDVLSVFTRETTEVRAETPEDTPVTAVTLVGLSVLSATPESTKRPDLRGINLSHAKVDAVSFRLGTSLTDTDFRQSTISGLDARGVVLTGATFKGSSLAGSKLSFSNCDDTDFSLVSASECDFQGVSMNQTDLSSSTFERVNFAEAELSRADLRRGVFAECTFIEARFREVDVRGCDLRTSSLEGAVFYEVVHDETTMWPAKFDSKRLRDPDVDGG